MDEDEFRRRERQFNAEFDAIVVGTLLQMARYGAVMLAIGCAIAVVVECMK